MIHTYASKVVIIIPHPKTPLHFQTVTPAKQGVYRSKTLYALNSFTPHIHPPCSLIHCKHRSIGHCHLSLQGPSSASLHLSAHKHACIYTTIIIIVTIKIVFCYISVTILSAHIPPRRGSSRWLRYESSVRSMESSLTANHHRRQLIKCHQ